MYKIIDQHKGWEYGLGLYTVKRTSEALNL